MRNHTHDISFIGRPVFYVIIISVIIACVCIVGITMNVLGNPFSQGSAQLNPADVQSVEIKWEQGDIVIRTGDTDKISITEVGNIKKDHRLIYRVTDKVLHIQDHLPWFLMLGSGEKEKKDLIITIPQTWACKDLSILKSSSAISVDGIQAESITFTAENCELTFTDCQVETMSNAGLVSDCTINYEGLLNKLNLNTRGTDFLGVFQDTPSEFKVKNVLSGTGRKGRFEIALPQDTGFVVNDPLIRTDFTTQRKVNPETAVVEAIYYGDQRFKLNFGLWSSYSKMYIHINMDSGL